MTEAPTDYHALALPAWERFVLAYWHSRRAQDPIASPIRAAEDYRQLTLMVAGLAGETGEALELVKKHVRDGVIDEHELGLELGDVLYCLTRLALRYGFTLADLQRLARGKLARRAVLGKDKAGEADPAELAAWAEQDAVGEAHRRPA